MLLQLMEAERTVNDQLVGRTRTEMEEDRAWQTFQGKVEALKSGHAHLGTRELYLADRSAPKLPIFQSVTEFTKVSPFNSKDVLAAVHYDYTTSLTVRSLS